MKAENYGTNQLIKSSMTQRCLPITLFIIASSPKKYIHNCLSSFLSENYFTLVCWEALGLTELWRRWGGWWWSNPNMPFLLPPQFSSRDLFPAFPLGSLCNSSQAGSSINSKKTFCHTIVYLSILFLNTRIRMFVRESLIVLCHVSLPGKRKTLSEESTFGYFSLWLLSDSDRFLQVFFAPSLTYVPARQWLWRRGGATSLDKGSQGAVKLCGFK